MKTTEIVHAHGIEFPWKVSSSKGKTGYKNLDERIRRCEYDDETIQKEKVTNDFLKQLEEAMNKDKNIFLFVHHSQFMFTPVYCILLDAASPLESMLDLVNVAIAKKFKPSNFDDKSMKKFHDLLYSKRNLQKLKKFGLEIQEPDHYDY